MFSWGVQGFPGASFPEAFLRRTPQEFPVRRTNSWSVVTPWCVAKRIPDAFLGRFPAAYVPGNAIAFFAVAGGRLAMRFADLAALLVCGAADQQIQAHQHS